MRPSKKNGLRIMRVENFTVVEISELFHIDRSMLYRWIYQYSNYQRKNTVIVEMKDSASQKLKDYQKRIADLERALGQKQLNIDYLEKLIEIANGTYSIDIKKNANTPSSAGSGNTSKN